MDHDPDGAGSPWCIPADHVAVARWIRKKAPLKHARALRADDTLGEGICVPDALDAAAIAIGHHLKDGIGALATPGNLQLDLRVLVDRAGLESGPLSSRLREHGLRRAGIAAFLVLAEEDAR